MPQLLFLCMLWLCLASSVAGCSWESLPTGTVATVNSQPISLRVLNAVQALSHFQHSETSAELSVDALREQYGIALASLIVHSLVVQELRGIGLEVSHERIQAEEERIRADYPEGEFEQALLETQMDIQTWRELLHNQLALELFAEQVLPQDAGPSPQEVLAYYAEHEKTFSYPASLYLRIISGVDHDRVENARAALLGSSDTPLPPEILEQKTAMSKASVPEEWRKDVESLKPGEISPVRKGQFQYQAVQLLEEISANHMSVVEAYPLIEKALIEKKVGERYAHWIEQAVQKADIRVSVYLRQGSTASESGEK